MDFWEIRSVARVELFGLTQWQGTKKHDTSF